MNQDRFLLYFILGMVSVVASELLDKPVFWISAVFSAFVAAFVAHRDAKADR